MTQASIDLDRLLKLRLVVARFGEIDLATGLTSLCTCGPNASSQSATDRSLAIAHGLEDVFWVEGTDGKRTARKTPTCTIDELVRERTSPAVKAALKSLLEAPVATGSNKKSRKGTVNA